METIDELYDKAPRFDEGDLYQSEEYSDHIRRRTECEVALELALGGRYELIEDFLEVVYEMTEFECRHFFEQGYLAAKKGSRL